MRGILEYIALAGNLAFLDLADLLADADKSFDKSVELFLTFRLGRLDHERISDRPTHGGGVETVVLKALGDINSFNACCAVEGPDVEDELVGTPAMRVGIEDGIMFLEFAKEVVRIEQCDLGGLFEPFPAWDVSDSSLTVEGSYLPIRVL